MSIRYLSRMILAVLVVTTITLSGVSIQAQSNWEPPRLEWGAPDLQGVWDFRTLTPFERPEELGDKAVLTDEEVAEYEATRLAAFAVRDDQEPADVVGNYNQFWFDPGETANTNRTSLVVDPPNGRVPELTISAARERAEYDRIRRGLLMHDLTPGGWVEDMGSNALQVRCIVGFNSGPPMTPGGYNQNVQLFQTETHVVLLNEMVHHSRVIPLGESGGHLDANIRQWKGDSRGHWDGDTLVVETTNFLRETGFRSGLSDENLKLTERFTRVSPTTLMYEATIDDPTIWSQPWTYQIPMQSNDQPLYEYACHEGNYGLYNMLAGAREAERAEEEVASH